MDYEAITALDDTRHNVDVSLDSGVPFSPPSLSASQFKQLELLQHLSLYSELVILFSGEKGMGKTFIAQALIASREDPDHSLIIEADFLLPYLDILHQIAQHIDLPVMDDISGLEHQIVERCQQLQEDDQGSFLLIVDNADQLTNDVLLNLNQLALMKPSALHVMFLGMPSLEEILVSLPEPHAPLHTMQTEYLTESESEVLLLEQFPQQDWSGEQVDYMLTQAKGNPGKLMYIAQQLASGATGQDEQEEKSKFPLTHIAALLLIASVLGVSFLYKNSQTTVADSVEVSEIVNLVVPPVTANDAINTTPLPPGAWESVDEEEIDFNFIEPATATSASDFVSQSTRPAIDSPVLKDNAKNVEDVNVTSKSNDDVAMSSERFSPDEQRLMDTKSSAFITQLFASYSEKNAQVFILENKSIIDSIMYYRTEYKGKPWFVVVSGPFDSKASAKANVIKLPAELRKQKPWVRSVEPIQALLNTRS